MSGNPRHRGERAAVAARRGLAGLVLVRFETWTPEHDLLASSPSDGTVTLLTPQTGDPAGPPAQSTIISGRDGPQGLAFDRIGTHEFLYVAETDEVDRYVWTGTGVGARTLLIPGLPDTEPAGDDVHTLKDVVAGADHTIDVDVGSSSNARPRDLGHGIPRASVLAYHPTARCGPRSTSETRSRIAIPTRMSTPARRTRHCGIRTCHSSATSGPTPEGNG
jgi:hypothetical protein